MFTNQENRTGKAEFRLEKRNAEQSKQPGIQYKSITETEPAVASKRCQRTDREEKDRVRYLNRVRKARTREKRRVRAIRKLKKAAGLLAAMTVFCVLGSGFTVGYDVCYRGKTIGVMPSVQAAEAATDQVAEAVGSEVTDSTTYFLKLVPKQDFSGVQELKEQLFLESGTGVPACVLLVDGKALLALPTEADMVALLDAYKAEAVGEDRAAIFDHAVLWEETAVPAGFLSTPEEAAALIRSQKEDGTPLLRVLQTVYQKGEETVPYETQEIPDNTLVEGATKTVQEGKNGSKTVEAFVTMANGSEFARKTVSEAVTEEAVPAIVHVGTRKRQKGEGTGSFIVPYHGVVSSRFGPRRSGNHTGLDLAGPTGSTILAADSGIVSFVGWQGGYGNLIKVDHQNGYVTYYAHCSQILKSEGEMVEKGDAIACVGSTGNSTGPHLHFEVRKENVPQNPLNYIKP